MLKTMLFKTYYEVFIPNMLFFDNILQYLPIIGDLFR